MRGVPLISTEGQAQRGDGKRFIVRADEKLTAFMELQAAIHRQLELA
jgi:hypothetical protein